MKKYISEIEQKKKFHDQQVKLKKKHHLDADVVVLEKSNLLKFIISTIAKIVETVFYVGIGVLATLGVISLIYPQTREPLFQVMIDNFQYIKNIF